MTPEGKVKAKVKKLLLGLDVLGRAYYSAGVYHFSPVQNGMGSPSLDILCCINGKFVAIETKVDGKEATPRQQQTIAEIRKAGGLAFVVHGMDCVGSDPWWVQEIRRKCFVKQDYNPSRRE